MSKQPYRHHIPQTLQRGDTIVEVLISITVIALVLAGAYVTTNHSIQNTRQAQERANALKLAESQVEQLKGVVESNPTAIFSNPITNGNFCIYSNAPVVTTNVHCTQGTDGNPAGSEPKFALSITRTNNTFVVTNTWNDINGRTTDSMQLTYRAYP